MGDLIQKLPTDSTPLPPDEKQNFIMLFPEETQPNPHVVSPPQKQQSSFSSCDKTSPQKLKKEVLSLFMFILIFFLLNLPFVKQLFVEYIPLCSKSWMFTNLLQAIVFAFVLWIIINSEYSRV